MKRISLLLILLLVCSSLNAQLLVKLPENMFPSIRQFRLLERQPGDEKLVTVSLYRQKLFAQYIEQYEALLALHNAEMEDATKILKDRNQLVARVQQAETVAFWEKAKCAGIGAAIMAVVALIASSLR